MLVKLTAEQVSSYWKLLKPAIIKSLPPTAEYTERGINEIFKQLLSDDMQAWALINIIDDKTYVQAIATTLLSSDLGTGNYNLLIYTLFSFVRIDNLLYKDIVDTLKKYAKDHNCFKIIAYTNIDRIVEVSQELFGARVDFKLLSLEV